MFRMASAVILTMAAASVLPVDVFGQPFSHVQQAHFGPTSETDVPIGANSTYQYVAQTITASATGAVMQVRLDIRDANPSSAPDLRITIFDAPGGVPSSTILGSVTLNRDHTLRTFEHRIDLDPVIPITAGQTYMIAADYPSLPSDSTDVQSVWGSRGGNMFLEGSAFTGISTSPSSISWTPLAPGQDLYFEAYIDTFAAPEPASTAMSSIGLIFIAAVRRQFLRSAPA